jgi:hypothetical protein
MTYEPKCADFSAKLITTAELGLGHSEVEPRFTLHGLNSDLRYDLTFYASVLGTSDNLETVFTVDGLERQTAQLNPANNLNGFVTVPDVVPDAHGSITVELAAGAANSSPFHLTSIGALVVETVGPAMSLPRFDAVEMLHGTLSLEWSAEAILERAEHPAGPWTEVIPGSASSHSESVGETPIFFRLRLP